MAADLFVSWADYHRQSESLIAQIHRAGWAFEHIVCIARGGLRVGDVVSRAFRKPLAIISAQGGKVSAQVASLNDTLSGGVLLVDDVAVTGATLASVKAALRARYPAIAEIRTAVLWQQGSCAEAPDYRADYLAHNPRIHPPYELYDFSSLEGLVQRTVEGNSRGET